MGLFGFGKKKDKVDVDKLTEEMNRSFDKTVKDMDFNALLKEKEEAADECPVSELTEENLLNFISEHSGHPAAMSTTLGSVYDFSDPSLTFFLQGDLEERFDIQLPDVFEEDMTVSQLLGLMKRISGK